MENKILKIDWNRASFTEIKKVSLEVGQRVYGVLGYGGSESGTFIVATEPDEHNKQTLVEVGGKHRFDYWTIGHNDDPISKKFGIGLYWDDIEPDYRMPSVEIIQYMHDAIVQRDWNKRRDSNARKASLIKREALRDEYRNILVECDGHSYDRKIAKKNMLILLKHQYPGVRFNCRRSSYDSYVVSWVDGPKEDSIASICRRFIDTTFNGMEDIEENCSDEFTNLFGGIGCRPCLEREYSEANREAATAKFYDLHPEACGLACEYDYFTPACCSEFVEKLFQETSPAICIKNYLSNQNYYVCPEKIEAKKTIENVSSSDFEIVEYSEKAIAVFGDTKPYKKMLFDIGGRFNSSLSYGDGKRAGWIFSKKKRVELMAVLQ